MLRDPLRFVFTATSATATATRTFVVTVEGAVQPSVESSLFPISTGPTASTTVQPGSAPTGDAQLQLSANWGGYVYTTPSVDALVGGSWSVPRLNCAQTPNANSATWVGVGGAVAYDLLQTGVEDDCVNGVQLDTGFWELFPEDAAQVFSRFPLHPGDEITASVLYDGTHWDTDVTDETTGLTGYSIGGLGWGTAFAATHTLRTWQGPDPYFFAGGRTAEWIEESPSVGSLRIATQPPLANFGTLQFTRLSQF